MTCPVPENITEESTTEESTTEPVRRLVTVQRIVDLIAIPGKDRIELAKVLGYRVIVGKGLHKIGQLVAFHEEGSFVPVAAEHGAYADLAKLAKVTPAGETRARIKTIKMGGVYSQGYIVPLRDLKLAGDVVTTEGADLTATLDVVKYDDAMRAVADPNRPRQPDDPRKVEWPSAKLIGISKTDEERLQSAPFLLAEMKGRSVAITNKLDGSSLTVARDVDGEVIVCSRNHRWIKVDGEPLPSFLAAVEQLGIADKLAPGTAVQGELCGPGIQSNRMGFDRLKFFAFNVFRRLFDDEPWEEQGFKAGRGILRDAGLVPVPAILNGLILDGRYDVDWFATYAAGQKYPNGYPCEGIVVRPETPTESDKLGRRLSFKVISAEWELKQAARN